MEKIFFTLDEGNEQKWSRMKPHTFSLAVGGDSLFFFDGINYALCKIGSGENGTIPGEVIRCKKEIHNTLKEFKLKSGLPMFEDCKSDNRLFASFSTKRKSSAIIISSNKFDARRPSRNGKKYCSVTLDTQFPSSPGEQDLPMYSGAAYFEVKILNLPDAQIIGIGFIDTLKFELDGARMLGWDEGSYGYHSDDGGLFGQNKTEGTHWPKWSEGDIIGCGIDYTSGHIFYTHNGKMLGNAFDIRANGTPVRKESLFPFVVLIFS